MSQLSSSKDRDRSGFTVAKQTALYQQHLDKSFCDVIIGIKDEEFYVHSCIVAASCLKLQSLIDERKRPRNSILGGPAYEVDLDDGIFTPKVFEFILSYIYLGVLDWTKVAPGLVNQILDAANWCGFNQLIEDYMMSQEEDAQLEVEEGSTIVMVDTCLDEDDLEDVEEEAYIDQQEEIEGLVQDVAHEGLYCIVCNQEFALDDERGLEEHMKAHEMGVMEPARRGGSKRKAALAVKEAYRSLIPSEKISLLSKKRLEKKKRDLSTKKQSVARTAGKAALFKRDFTCKFCEKNFSSRKELKHHEEEECSWKDQPGIHLQPLTTEEIANHLLAELITGNNSSSNVLPSTKGVTVQTGTFIRSYKNKNGEESEGVVAKKLKTAKLWICPRCPDVVFDKKRDQLNHIRSVHGAIKRHICEHCGKSLDGKNALALHMRIHTGERPYTCPTCGRGFSERKTMEDHTRRHTGERPFLCTICGKDFGYRQSLYRHMKFHVGERPYRCQVCNKSFVLRQNLQEHVARHNKHQLISCHQCEQRFTSKDLLLQHQLEVHVENKAYESQEATQSISVLDMTEGGEPQTTSYEVTIDNSVLQSLTEQ